MSTPEVYRLSKTELVKLGSAAIFEELTGYIPNGRPKKPTFGETFYVKIYPDEDEEAGIQYFASLANETPFFTMGLSDTGFTLGSLPSHWPPHVILHHTEE
jgi:hypothetical protein